jgi:hypothetical protein
MASSLPTAEPSEVGAEEAAPASPEVQGASEDEEQPPAHEVPAEVNDIPPRSWDVDPCHRVVDRFLARQGALLDAAPRFAPGRNLPHVGLLLAIPNLVQSGVLEEAGRLYGDLGPAFYGLRTPPTLGVLLSLLRLKRPKHLKEYSPSELGRVVGLDRVPEVKTLRRKFDQLAEGPVEAFLLALA